MPIRYAWSGANGPTRPASFLRQRPRLMWWRLRFGPVEWDSLARGHAAEARTEIDELGQIEQQLRASGNDYWATQVAILTREVMAWSAQADEETG